MTAPLERLALKPEEVAELLNISRAKAYAAIRRGSIPSIKVDGVIRVPRRALEAWIDEQTRGAG